MGKLAAVTLAALVAVTAWAAPARAEAPRDFIADALVYYRVVACGGDAAIPSTMDQAVVDKHCTEMTKRYGDLDKSYIKPAREFFATVQPANLPTTVVYPFGGGDLLGALVTYPNAREITTISLEHAGDPTRLAGLDKAHLASALASYRDAIEGLLSLHDSTSDNMKKLERGGIPGQLSFHITGMAALGYLPVSLKFFRIEDDGTLHYYTQSEIDALASKTAKKVKGGWVDTDFSEAFTNMELTFKKAGDDTASAPLIVHRHVAANLANKAFKGSGLEKYLLARGKIVAMTKAASYLIWDDSFTGIRDFLLANMVWMASDSTGIAPAAAKKAGFTQTTYGSFTGPFLPDANKDVGAAMVRLWGAQPHRKLAFRYGYPDSDKAVHLMITAPASDKGNDKQ
ncbi:MAG TPA: hypothetical protein VH914_13150 [Acidimicrobiia bacterium]|jgi:hypothetical protein|nr:hypothetical protein [Acidimicrobiia bacterium]